MNQIGERLQAVREEQGITQDALCARLASHTNGEWNPGWQDISRIENGSRLVSDLEILALAAVVGCRPAWLLTGEMNDTLVSE
jgi:transcriptional regulator with XRE-family HTH domain